MPHSAVVIRFETALPLRTREKGGDVSDPPQKQGGHAVPHRWHLEHASVPAPHGVAHVLIYPCGKAWKNPPFPSRFIVSDRSSPSRVRFAASRPGRLRADPKDALLTRGKGGSGRGAGEVSRMLEELSGLLAHDNIPYHALATRLSPRRRFPRTRGDRPYLTACSWYDGAVPPHTQG